MSGLFLVPIILAVGVSAMGLVAIALMVGHEPQVEGNSTLVLKVRGDLAEMEPAGVIGQLFETPSTEWGISSMRCGKRRSIGASRA